MEEKVAQIQTFIGYEHEINAAVKSAQQQANSWMGYHRLRYDHVHVTAQTITEVIPAQSHVFYLHIITIVYPAG